MQMHCPNCEESVSPDDRFCGVCGTAMSAAAPEAASIDPKPSAATALSDAITRVDYGDKIQDWISAAMPRDRAELHRLAAWLFGFTILFWLVLSLAFGFASWIGFIWTIAAVTYIFSWIAFVVIGWMKQGRYSALVTGRSDRKSSS